jgi:hypothetical protein
MHPTTVTFVARGNKTNFTLRMVFDSNEACVAKHGPPLADVAVRVLRIRPDAQAPAGNVDAGVVTGHLGAG